MIEKFEFKCMETIDTMPILRTYCKIKKSFECELYLNHVASFSIRSTMSKLRLSSHELEIETGHHRKPKLPIEQRLCILRNSGKIEDVTHLLLECAVYKEERSKLLTMSHTKPK